MGGIAEAFLSSPDCETFYEKLSRHEDCLPPGTLNLFATPCEYLIVEQSIPNEYFNFDNISLWGLVLYIRRTPQPRNSGIIGI